MGSASGENASNIYFGLYISPAIGSSPANPFFNVFKSNELPKLIPDPGNKGLVSLVCAELRRPDFAGVDGGTVSPLQLQKAVVVV